MKTNSKYYFLLLYWTICLLLMGNAAGRTQLRSAYAQTLPPDRSVSALSIQAVEPLLLAQARPPVRLAIPALDFAVAVTPMAWAVSEVDGQRRAIWQVPEANVGWHVNSAGVGAAGNVVLSGYQRRGAAVFAALARGEVEIGQTLLLMDDLGQTFVYRVTTLVDPIPALGATQDEQARNARYLALGDQPRLTLITGWPEFSDTHTLIVVATLVGRLVAPGVDSVAPATPPAASLPASLTATRGLTATALPDLTGQATLTATAVVFPTATATPSPTHTRGGTPTAAATTASPATATATPDLAATVTTIKALIVATLTAQAPTVTVVPTHTPPPTHTPDRAATVVARQKAVVATLTILAPTATATLLPPTMTPDLLATEVALQRAVAATLTALAPTLPPTVAATATPSPTSTAMPTHTPLATNTPAPTQAPDLVATAVVVQQAVEATLTAAAPTALPTATATNPPPPTHTPDLAATAVIVQQVVGATLTAQAPTATPMATASNTPTPTQLPDLVATGVVVQPAIQATLTALVPIATPTQTPDLVATGVVVQPAVQATLTALAPIATPTQIPDLVATGVVVQPAVQATLTALAPTATATPTWTPFVVTATPTPIDVFAAATLVVQMTADAQTTGTVTPTPPNMIVAATATRTPTASATPTLLPSPLVVTATATPVDVFAAATAVMQMTVWAQTTGTATPTPPNMIVVTTTLPISVPYLATLAPTLLAMTATPILQDVATVVLGTITEITPTVTPAWTRFAVIATPTLVDRLTAATVAARITQEAQTTGTATPTPPNLLVVTVTSVATVTPQGAKSPPAGHAVAPVAAPVSITGKILFLADADGQGGPEAYAINPDGKQLTRLPNLDVYNRALAAEAFSSDKLRRAFSRREMSGEQAIQIFYEDSPGRFTQQVTFLGGVTAWSPAWSPTQEAIAFVVTYRHNDEIWLAARQHGEWISHALTPNQWHRDRHPSWSPDGKQIVFVSDRAEDRRQLWVMSADGSGLRQIINLAFEVWDPVWVKQ